MNLPVRVSQEELLELLLHVAPVRPVFIWGAPGIGKSSLVEAFADSVGLPCVSLLGSPLALQSGGTGCALFSCTVLSGAASARLSGRQAAAEP